MKKPQLNPTFPCIPMKNDTVKLPEVVNYSAVLAAYVREINCTGNFPSEAFYDIIYIPMKMQK